MKIKGIFYSGNKFILLILVLYMSKVCVEGIIIKSFVNFKKN